MADPQELAAIVQELIEVFQLQARDLEKIVAHLEQTTDRLKEPSQLPLVVSELTGLHQRAKALRACLQPQQN